MLPPKVPGTIVLRTSPPAGATPRQPRNGASGTSHACRPSRDAARATLAADRHRSATSSRGGRRRASPSGRCRRARRIRDRTTTRAYARAGSTFSRCTATVSPGSAPSTWNGPVCGLSCPAGITWDGRSAAVFTAPSKQSSLHDTMRVPGVMRCFARRAAERVDEIGVRGRPLQQWRGGRHVAEQWRRTSGRCGRCRAARGRIGHAAARAASGGKSGGGDRCPKQKAAPAARK